MLGVWLIVGPMESAQQYAADRGWRSNRVDYAETADDLRYAFDPTRHEGVVLVEVARLLAREVAKIGDELRIIRTVWPEVRIADHVVAQIDNDPGRVPVLC
jgi:hypothetical protein